jgi:hypothetical protein
MPPVDLLQNNTMKQIIRMCAEHNLDLKAVRLEKEQIRLIENLADKMDKSFSQTMRVIIDKYFKR